MKRWLAFVLICVFFINILPFQAAAAEDEFVYISVIHNGHEKTYRVIKAGAQLLFAGEDLASFGGYTYRVEGDNAYFTRGMKTIRVNMARSSLIPYDGTIYSDNQKNITLKTSVRNVDGTNYFPGTQLLPWLSVNCSAEEGKLKITSDEITIWELLEEFDPDDYTFDFAKCCEELGEKSKWVKAWAGLQGFGFDSILGWLPSLGGNSKEEHNYYDIFEDMLQDQTCSESSLDELMEDIDKFNQWMEWIEIIGMEEELPDELRAMAAIFKGIGSVPNQFGAELGFYLTTVDQDNQVKVNALKYIVLRGSGFSDSMDAAAQTIIVEYEDRILGILGKGIDTLMDVLKDSMGDLGGIIFKIVLKAIDIPELVSVECSEGIRRVDFYDTIAKGSATAYKEERDRLADAAVSGMGIQDARSMAYLYLYASEQNWRAMYEYAMYQEKYDLAKEYALRADAAEEMAAQFLASAYAQLNDSPKYGNAEVQRKQEYTDQLKEMFATVLFQNCYVSESDYLNFLTERQEYSYYALVDINQDGISEMLATDRVNSDFTSSYNSVDLFIYENGEISLTYEDLWSKYENLSYDATNKWIYCGSGGTGASGFVCVYLDTNLNVQEHRVDYYWGIDEHGIESSHTYYNDDEITDIECDAYNQLIQKMGERDLQNIIFEPIPRNVPGTEENYVHSYRLGTSVCYDLDGDGVYEQISITEQDCVATLTINGITYELDAYWANPTEFYSILNIDASNNELLIGVSDYGTSDDSVTFLYAYEQGCIQYVGCFDDLIGQPEWSAKCNGDGTISANTRMNDLGTWIAKATYAVNNHSITDITDFYRFADFYGYDKGKEVTTKCDLPMYDDLGLDNVETIIPSGTTVTMLGCRRLNENTTWIAFESTEFSNTKWILVNTGYWPRYIVTSYGMIEPTEAFEGVYFAG